MSQKRIYVVYPIRHELEDLYEIIKTVIEELGAVPVCNDEIYGIDQFGIVASTIESCDVLVSDLTKLYPDVMYEIGYAHALNKPVVQICEEGTSIPFDVSRYKTLIYNRNSLLKKFRGDFKIAIESAMENPKEWSIRNKMITNEIRNRKIFISYSHKDKDCLDRLLVHLKPLEKEGLIDLWVDTKLTAGDKWRIRIEESLKNANVAVLMISADFLASDFIVDNELPPLLSAAEEEGTRIIPIVLKPCRFSRDRNLSVFQSINDPKYPLLSMDAVEQEKIYDKVSTLIENHIRNQ